MTLIWSLVFLAGLWASNLLMYFSRMSLTPQSVQTYYLGSEAQFRAPRSFASLLETAHTHLPIFALAILLVTHLLIFADFSDRRKKLLITTTFATALLNESSGWLVRYLHPAFSWLKILSFSGFQLSLGLCLFLLARFLLAGPSSLHTPPHHKSR
ncbi:MAG: hypothetical protein HY402_03625 [Elusimicrobia bacterium]|nr:hypothetical protein [Elusimicrobiota bacterium]